MTPHHPRIATFAFIGFGELGSALARGLAAGGRSELRAWSRPRDAEPARRAMRERIESAGASQAGSLEDAVRGAACVLSVVPAGASAEVAERCLPLLDRGACFADLTAAAPEAKERAALAAAEAGVRYVDGAVLGTVAMSGHEVPIAAAGPGAAGFRDLVAPAGLRVEVVGDEPGQAARLKLIRSVYMKGRDALVLETMVAARRYGLEHAVAESIAGPGERVPFTDLAERVLKALAIHAGRRADELAASGELLREAGVDPVMAEAGAERLRRLAELGLREELGGERPEDAGAVLDAIERRAGR